MAQTWDSAWLGWQDSNLGIQRLHPEAAETFLWTSAAKEALVGAQIQTD